MNYNERKIGKVKKAEKDMILMSKVNIIVFITFLLLGFSLIMFLPKPTVSEYERRELERFPEFSVATLFNGEYAKAINMYVADTFPFRDTFVSMGVNFNDVKGIRVGGVRFYSGTDWFLDFEEGMEPIPVIIPPITTAPQVAATPEQTSALQPLSETSAPEETDLIPEPAPEPEPLPAPDPDQEPVGQQVNNVFVVGDMGLELFGGVPSIGESYATVLNNYRVLLPDHVNIYNILVPTHSQFALPQRYRGMVNCQQNAINHIYSRLSDGITTVNAYDKLHAHQNEYLYFRTDHHWTALGAYYAYLAFAEAAGIEPVAREDLDYGKIETFLGSFYSWTRDVNMRNNPDFVEFFRPRNSRDYSVVHYLADGTVYHGSLIAGSAWNDFSGYLIFINGDQPHTHITTPNKNGRRLMVFKESYGNPFVPFAAMHYEEIHVADIRYFPHNAINFINEKNIDDVIFINSVFVAYTPVRISNINNLAG
jgi:hypothetical protein